MLTPLISTASPVRTLRSHMKNRSQLTAPATTTTASSVTIPNAKFVMLSQNVQFSPAIIPASSAVNGDSQLSKCTWRTNAEIQDLGGFRHERVLAIPTGLPGFPTGNLRDVCWGTRRGRARWGISRNPADETRLLIHAEENASVCRMCRHCSKHIAMRDGLSILPLLLHGGLKCGLKILGSVALDRSPRILRNSEVHVFDCVFRFGIECDHEGLPQHGCIPASQIQSGCQLLGCKFADGPVVDLERIIAGSESRDLQRFAIER